MQQQSHQLFITSHLLNRLSKLKVLCTIDLVDSYVFVLICNIHSPVSKNEQN